MTQLSAVVINTADLQPESWDDPSRGSISWQTILSADVTNSNSLVCGLATLDAGDHFALHHHQEAEVYFGVEGEADVTVNGKSCRLAPGVTIFIPQNAVHGIAAVKHKIRFFYVFAADTFGDIDYSFMSDPTPPK